MQNVRRPHDRARRVSFESRRKVKIIWHAPLVALVGFALTFLVYGNAWNAASYLMHGSYAPSIPSTIASAAAVLAIAVVNGLIVFAILPYKKISKKHFVVCAIWWTALVNCGPAILWLGVTFIGMF